jgi:hypothetical protein
MFEHLRAKFLKERVEVLSKVFDLNGISILDLGGYDGRYMDYLKKKYPDIQVTIADQDRQGLLVAGKKGYNTIFLDGAEKKPLPFSNKQFDLVFCNSVIEHVTIKKDIVWDTKDTADFKRKSWEIQKHFANEIERISKNYFVQTPNRNFFIEHHSWLPFIQFLPRNLLVKFLRFSNKFWIKQTAPDWNLLDAAELESLFPSSTILKEKFLFMNKSLIAYKR